MLTYNIWFFCQDNCNGEDIKLRDADSAFDIVQQQDC